jgi:hypothetical protein
MSSEVTPEQERWWRRLTRTIKDMPPGVEILVRDGGIALAERGATDVYFKAHGDVDNVPTMAVYPIQCGRIKDIDSAT